MKGLGLGLCAVLQHQRRRLHIKNALAPVEDALSGITLSESNESANMGEAPTILYCLSQTFLLDDCSEKRCVRLCCQQNCNL